MRKYCRICWNTRNWREPTAEASKLEKGDSYVRSHGFGHEEWLFNFQWVQPAGNDDQVNYKYSFLQPIGKYRETYEGKFADVLTYVVSPDGNRVAVALIKNLFVPELRELSNAVTTMRARGWIKAMEDDLLGLGLKSKALKGPPNHLINVRFKPDDVVFFDPRIVLPKSHVLYRVSRYQPINWDESLSISMATEAKKSTDGKRRSEEERERAATSGTTYSPTHVRLQNALYDWLCTLHGKSSVHYEQSFVDLALNQENSTTYFEIKTALTAKACIREAIGQLLEYGIYPDTPRAAKFVVVGDRPVASDDRSYLHFLRSKFNIPLYYCCWDWEQGRLDEET